MDRKEQIRRYKETARPVGVFGVRHAASGRTFVGSSIDVPARLNRTRFQLDHGSHPHRALQNDWKTLGPEAFVLETLDLLEIPADRPGYDPADDLRALEGLWRDKLAATGQLYE